VPVLNDNALDLMTGLGINTSINGSRTNANLLTVDGGSTWTPGATTARSATSTSTRSRRSASRRRTSRPSTAATPGRHQRRHPRGTNRFRGSAYEYLRREELDANDPFANARGVAKPELKYDNFGGTVGGPIMKDKLFFFGALECGRSVASPARRSARCRTASSAPATSA